jgi:hypothetical protein
MPTTTDVDRHRIACECFEGHRGFVPSDLRVKLKKRLADFEDRAEALEHCMAMCKRWKTSGVTNPSALTEVLTITDVQPEIESPDILPETEQAIAESIEESPIADGGIEPDPSLSQGDSDAPSGP